MGVTATAFRVLGVLVAAVVILALLGVTLVGVNVLALAFLGERAAMLVGVVVALGTGAVGVVSGRSKGLFTLRVAGYLLAIGLVTAVFLVAVYALVAAVVAFALPVEPFGVAAGVTLALTACCLVGLLATVRNADDRTDWALTLRMVFVTVALALCAVAFVVGTWLATFLVSVLTLPTGVRLYAAVAVTVGVVVVFGYVEYRQILTVEGRADATPVTPEDYPELHARTTRIASQLGVPAPTVALAHRPTPEAMVVGFRPGNAHLVLSTGLLDALDGDELDAVVAHELAHVANRDAMVMTAVSAPVVITDGLLRYLRDDGVDLSGGETEQYDDDPVGDHTDLTEAELYGDDGEWAEATMATKPDDTDDDETSGLFFLAPVAYIVWGFSRILVAILSRSRETVADEVAAGVTGSPAALASALRTLDDRIETTPDHDLRAASGVSALSILPLEEGGVTAGGSVTGDPGLLDRVRIRLFSTHPSTERRVERLTSMEAEQEQ